MWRKVRETSQISGLKDLRLRIFKWANNRSKLRKVEGVYASFILRTSLENTEVLMN